MAFTKIVGAGIHTLSNVNTHNINSSGIITATKFVGPFDGSSGDFSGNVSIGGSLTVNGDFTTLNTTLREIELLRVDANNDSAIAGIITQSGSAYGLYVDGTTVLGNTQLLPSLGAGTKAVAADLSGNGNWVDFTIFGGRSGRSILNFGDHDDQDAGAIKYYHSDNSLNFTTNGSATERLTITSAGITSITGADDQDNFVVDVAGTQFAIHSDASDGELSLRAQDGSGNNNSKYMTFFTQASGSAAGERLRIAEGGNIGIGTTNPQTKLHIVSNNPIIRLTDGNQAADNKSWNIGAGVTNTLRIQAMKDDNSGGGSLFDFYRSDNQVTEFRGVKSANTWFVINNEDQKVGVGLTNPSTPLHVYHATTNGVAVFQSGDAYCNLILQDGNSNTSSKPQFGVQGNDFRFVSYDGSSATEKLRIKANGSVGIGSDSPADKFDVMGNSIFGAESTADAHVQIGRRYSGNRNAIIDIIGDDNYYDYGLRIIRKNAGQDSESQIDHRGRGHLTMSANEEAPIRFTTNGGERLRIIEDGKVGIGVTNPQTNLHVHGNLLVEDNIGNNLTVRSTVGNGNDPNIKFEKGRGGAETTTIVQDNDDIGRFSWSGYDGSDYEQGAYILGEVEGTPGIGTMPIRMVLATRAESSANPIGRLVIGSDGTVTVANDGTLSIPDTIVHSGDTNTKIRFPAGDNISFETGGSERARITDSGVGIGSQIPEKQLTIRKGSGDGGGILVKPNVNYANDQNRAYLTVGTDNWDGTTTSWNTYGFQHRIKSSGVGVGRVTIDTNSGEAFCVENGGYVGIGTEDPKQNFHVNGNVRIDGNSESTPSLDVDNHDNLGNSAGDEQLLLNLHGNVLNDGKLMFTNTRFGNGNTWETATSRIQRIIDATKMGYIDFGTGYGSHGRDIEFGNGNGGIYMHLESNGNKVGIGTTLPKEKLDVRGKLLVSDKIATNRPRIVLSAPNENTDYKHLFGANLQVDANGTYTTPATNISGGGLEYLPANSINQYGSLRYISAPDTNATTINNGDYVLQERLRIDPFGRILIGRTANDTGTGTNPIVQIQSNSTNNYGRIEIAYAGGNTLGPGVYFVKARGNTADSVTAVANGDQCGAFFFLAADGSDRANRVASIQAFADAVGINSTPGHLRFGTTAVDSNATTERLRILSNGRLSIGDAIANDPWGRSGNANTGVALRTTSSGYAISANSKEIVAIFNRTNTGGTIVEYKYNASVVGEVVTDGTDLHLKSSNDTVMYAGGNGGIKIYNDQIIEMGTAIDASGADGNQRLRVGRTGDCNIAVRATGSTTAFTGLDFGDQDDDRAGRIQYAHDGNYMTFHTNGAGSGASNERVRITSTGVVELNTANNAHIRGGVYAKYTGASGNSANINTSSAGKISWLQTTGTTTIFQNGGFTNNATDVTVPYDGIYMVMFNGYLEGTGGVARTNVRFRFQVDGTDETADLSLNNYIRHDSSHDESSVNLTAYLNLSANQTVAVSAQQIAATGEVVLVKNLSSLTFHLVA